MRIAVLIQRNPFYGQGAAANRWQGLLNGLLNREVEIDIYCYGGFQERAEKDSQNTLQPGLRIFNVSQQVYDTLWKRRLLEYVLKPLFQGRLYARLQKVLKREFYDVFWMDHGIVEYKISLKLKAKYPDICLFAELSEFLDIHRYNKNNHLQIKNGDRRLELFEKYILPSLSGIAYMTQTLMDFYQNQIEKAPVAIHLPMTVSLERFEGIFKTSQEQGRSYLAYLGVMNNQKDGVDILIKSFARIAQEFPEVDLYLYGYFHPDMEMQKELIQGFNLEDRIFYKGAIPREEATRVMINARALLLPRPDSHQARGGFPTKLGEYLATGNPVCATSVGEIPDYLKDGESVFFAKPGSVREFADAMRKALSDTNNASQVGAKGKEIAETMFNAKIQSEQLFQFLNELKDAKK